MLESGGALGSGGGLGNGISEAKEVVEELAVEVFDTRGFLWESESESAGVVVSLLRLGEEGIVGVRWEDRDVRGT